MKRFLIVAAAGLVFSAPAWAACPQNSSNSSATNAGPNWFPGAGIAGVVSASDAPPGIYVTNVDPAYDPNCSTPATIGFGRAVSGEMEEYTHGPGPDGKLLDDPNTPQDETADNDVRKRQAIAPSVVLGPNNSALGNGASAYKEENYVDGGADGVGDNPNTPNVDESANDKIKKRIVPVSNATAIGAGSHVSHDGSTVIGAKAKSTDTHQVTLGSKNETIRAEGITSQKSKDRQVGPTELVTSDSGGRLATDGGQTFARIDSLESNMSSQGQAISAHSALLSQHAQTLDEHAKGLAIAMALPDAWIESNKRFAIAGNIGGFGDETAIGAAVILRLDDVWSINGKLGADTGFEEFGWTAGARASW